MPFFSIIVPVYNKEKFVANTIRSVLKQNFTDFEIIVINDGSTDQSEQEIAALEDSRIRYFFKENEGVAIARNFGISHATASYICFLDGDDYWYPSFLETMFYYVSKLPEQKVFAVAIEIETKNKTIPAQYSIPTASDYEIVNFFNASQKECILWTSSVCIHKIVFENIGDFDTKIKNGEDTELWIRIGLQYPIVFIAKILARYIYDSESISRNWNYFFEKYTFEKYALEEKQNLALKRYMDANRFSAVIKCKLLGDKKRAKELLNQIDLNNISVKKQIILKLPRIILKIMLEVQALFVAIGMQKSVFR